MNQNRLKRRFSGILTCAMVATLMPNASVLATSEEVDLNINTNEKIQVTTGSSLGITDTTTGSSIEMIPVIEIAKVTTPAAISLEGWTNTAFGNSIALESQSIEIDGNTITMATTDNKGKISSNKDGINFYYQELDADKDFKITVEAKVKALTANDQVSFGLMLRDTVGTHGESGSEEIQGARMLGVGGLKQKMMSFVRSQEKGKFAEGYSFTSSNAQVGTTYELGIKKSGNWYEFSVDGVVTHAEYSDQFTDNIYAGIYTARAATIEYSNLEIKEMAPIETLSIESTPDKTTYLEGEALDLAGLVVKADGQEIPVEDLMIAGYNPNQLGDQELTIHYAGQSATFKVQVEALTCLGIEVAITPAKTTYYIDDTLDLTGMVVKASYNSGKVETLTADDYTVSEVDLTTSGVKTVTVTFGSETASFDITVLADELKGLEIAKMPTKALYYIGESFESKGMAIKAIYGETKVLLEQNEYEITTDQFDSTVAGEQFVTVHYKGKTIDVPVTVKEKEATHFEVTALPKTTYEVGETFDLTGLEVSKVYDNGDKVVLTADAYQIDSSKVDMSAAGSYQIQIIPTDAAFKTVTFTVEVREPITYEWKYTTFGQSISESKNYIKHLADGGVKLVAEEGGGKITNSFQDGITYYYTELNNTTDNFVLSADIRVNEFAKPSPDNQEGFGIMARDAIGTHGDSSVFYSNIAAVGGYRGVTQMVMRSGVTSSDSAGAATGYQEEKILSNVRPTSSNAGTVGDYHLTLRKDNTGYTGTLTTPSGKVEHLSYQPDALGVQNDTLYVGFYAARLADIDVYNIDLEVTSVEADAPKVEAPIQAVTPAFNLSSLTSSSLKDYDLKMYANVNGTVTIKQGETIIARDLPVKGGEIYAQSTTLKENAVTNFTVTFTPDTDQNLTSYSKIVRNLSVEMKTYGTVEEAIYVSTTGSSTGEGTIESPLTIDRAINFVQPGQTIYLLEGDYHLTKAIGVSAGNNGTAEARKTLAAYPGAKVTINAGKKVSGFNLDGDYWHIFGIDFTGATSTGFRVGGNHNIVELCNFYSNGDTGMQISRYGNGGYDTWPAYNTILNCTSYDNIDASENNADGFAAKLTCGPGNVFKGCISHNNIDDAWDLFAKGSTGAIGAVTIEDCIAYGNGTLTNGYVGSGDKNGFKLGGEGIAVPHVIKNSIAFNNGTSGFSSNSNPAVISENCVSYDNGSANFDWRVYTDVVPQFKATGNISYRSEKGAKDIYPESLINNSNYYYDGEKSVNAKGQVLTDKNFKSLVVPGSYERDAQGNIIFGDFLKFVGFTNDSDSDDDYDNNNTTSGTNNDATSSQITESQAQVLIQAAIEKGEQVAITLGEGQKTLELSEETISELVKANAGLNIKAQNITLGMNSYFFSANILSQFTLQDNVAIKVEAVASQVFDNINKQISSGEAFKVVGDETVTVNLEVAANKQNIAFAEPADMSFDLKDIKVDHPAKLTLVKYELQKDGSYQVIKLGGVYDEKTNTITGKVSGSGIYGVVEAEELYKVDLTIGQVTSVVNDKIVTNDVAPEIVDGITMVPLRFIGENLGAEVKWHHKTKEVTVMIGEETVTLGQLEGVMIKENRALVPLRYIAESLGANVLWIPSAKEIQIVK